MQSLKSESWKTILGQEFKKPYYQKLSQFVQEQYQNKTVFPLPQDIFQALELTSFEDTKVVILGQDPYHGEFQANGLSFSVNKGVKIPPSLANIFKELEQDMGVKTLKNGDLSHWAKQGVLLLNATLTVEQKKPGSHQNKGWEEFTDAVIAALAHKKEHVVFILWGSYAHKKGKGIDASKHLVLQSVHPSPLSVYRGFYGSKPFSSTNVYLEQTGQQPIDWQVK